LLFTAPVGKLEFPLFFADEMGRSKRQKFTVFVIDGVLQFGYLGFEAGDRKAEVGVFASEVGSAGFESEEVSGVEGSGRGREAVEVEKFAVEVIGSHDRANPQKGAAALRSVVQVRLMGRKRPSQAPNTDVAEKA
jgi:hypothetical protein